MLQLIHYLLVLPSLRHCKYLLARTYWHVPTLGILCSRRCAPHIIVEHYQLSLLKWEREFPILFKKGRGKHIRSIRGISLPHFVRPLWAFRPLYIMSGWRPCEVRHGIFNLITQYEVSTSFWSCVIAWGRIPCCKVSRNVLTAPPVRLWSVHCMGFFWTNLIRAVLWDGIWLANGLVLSPCVNSEGHAS